MRNPLDTLRPDVRAINAYVVQDATGMVKLDAMENPHRLPIALQAELGQCLGEVALNRYPDGRVDFLRQVLAAHTGLPAGYGLILGNGSDEIINLLAIACNRPGATVLAPVPGFVMYGMAAQLLGLDFVGVPLTADFELDTPAMLVAIAQHQPAIVYLAYPNNPTANLWDDAAIEQIIEAAPGLVVIDEAYQPFSSKTYLDRLTRHPHVLLMRTLSKFGLAGVRLGYLIGPQALVAEIDKVRPPYNVSVLNCECALFALAHLEVFAAQAQEIRTQRAIISVALGVFPGVKVWPSDANMLLVRVPDAAKTFDGMKAQGVLVKNVSKMHPLLLNCVRITIGTAEENLRMLAAFQTTI
ncbi:histidinol-phosphate transaminase [Rhodoferax sp.]|uniref:histidinol-phosphate transaminase n=1 Tax=Rhodoferax sp. TaxID=50421 RepID=UPI0025E9EAB7|nr:histidinol-phosphate transaminase [Rhodoferax sp.]